MCLNLYEIVKKSDYQEMLVVRLECHVVSTHEPATSPGWIFPPCHILLILPKHHVPLTLSFSVKSSIYTLTPNLAHLSKFWIVINSNAQYTAVHSVHVSIIEAESI